MLFLAFYLAFLLLAVALVAGELLLFGSGIYSSILGAPYVPVNKEIARKMFSFLPSGRRGLFIDLGSGDGRVLRGAIAAGFKHAVVYELSWWPYLISKLLNRWHKVGDRADVVRRSLFDADISGADVVYAYLLPKMTDKILPKLSSELLRGAKIITCLFRLKDYESGFSLVGQWPIGNKTVYIYEKI